MLQNAYFLAKIGADSAENEQHFAEILPNSRARPVRGAPRGCKGRPAYGPGAGGPYGAPNGLTPYCGTGAVTTVPPMATFATGSVGICFALVYRYFEY